jgi:hypothetical protein
MENTATLPIGSATVRRPLQLRVKKVVVENLTESILRAQEPNEDRWRETCDTKGSCCAC